MRKRPDGGEPSSPSIIGIEAFKALFEAEHNPSHDQKWKHVPAAVAREALIRAQEIRDSDIDPGDAYLRGIADESYRVLREKLVAEVVGNFDPDTELSKLTDN